LAKKRIFKEHPRYGQKTGDVAKVESYLQDLGRSLNESKPRLFTGNVFVEHRAPTADDGQDGDVWIKY
jgi:hypothetical protein